MPSNNIERKTYTALPPTVGPYSHSVRNGNALYLSGFTAFGTEAQGQSLEKQTNAIFEQIKTVAVEEGIDMSSLLKK